MPARIPKPCRTTRCAQVTTDRSGYCDDHAEQRSSWHRYQDGRTATQRGYGHRWQKIRRRALERDSHLCQQCLREGRVTQATDVDHILRRASGGSDDLANLQSLCRPCHRSKTAREG